MDRSAVSRWANRFRGGCVSIDSYPRPERPRISIEERSVKLVADALEEDRGATCEELPRATGVPATSVFRILINDLKKRKISTPWAPHGLTTEQKQKHLDIVTLLKEIFNVGDQAFFTSNCRY